MIVEGKNMRNNGAREAKRHQKELNRVTSEHEKEINRLSRKLKSDETAKQFLSRAQDKERDLIKANHEREKRMAERERKRG